jgi:hypothetical protein
MLMDAFQRLREEVLEDDNVDDNMDDNMVV